jgi:predicted GIY-YIG superfamily endonuclease
MLMIDIDPRHGGHRSWASLEKRYGPFPECMIRSAQETIAGLIERERLAASEQTAKRFYERIEKIKRSAAVNTVAEGISDTFDPHGCFVYLLWGDDDKTPIYVGQSTNILSRLGSHLGQWDKKTMTRRVQLIRCADRAVMESTEQALIREYQPLLNIAGKATA